MPKRLMLMRGTWFACTAVLVAACASREVPTHYPKASAAAADARSACPANVTRSLAAETATMPTQSEPNGAEHTGHHGDH
jgi:hypothetical protein